MEGWNDVDKYLWDMAYTLPMGTTKEQVRDSFLKLYAKINEWPDTLVAYSKFNDRVYKAIVHTSTNLPEFNAMTGGAYAQYLEYSQKKLGEFQQRDSKLQATRTYIDTQIQLLTNMVSTGEAAVDAQKAELDIYWGELHQCLVSINANKWEGHLPSKPQIVRDYEAIEKERLEAKDFYRTQFARAQAAYGRVPPGEQREILEEYGRNIKTIITNETYHTKERMAEFETVSGYARARDIIRSVEAPQPVAAWGGAPATIHGAPQPAGAEPGTPEGPCGRLAHMPAMVRLPDDGKEWEDIPELPGGLSIKDGGVAELRAHLNTNGLFRGIVHSDKEFLKLVKTMKGMLGDEGKLAFNLSKQRLEWTCFQYLTANLGFRCTIDNGRFYGVKSLTIKMDYPTHEIFTISDRMLAGVEKLTLTNVDISVDWSGKYTSLRHITLNAGAVFHVRKNPMELNNKTIEHPSLTFTLKDYNNPYIRFFGQVVGNFILKDGTTPKGKHEPNDERRQILKDTRDRIDEFKFRA